MILILISILKLNGKYIIGYVKNAGSKTEYAEHTEWISVKASDKKKIGHKYEQYFEDNFGYKIVKGTGQNRFNKKW